jgi:hypothetical protein
MQILRRSRELDPCPTNYFHGTPSQSLLSQTVLHGRSQCQTAKNISKKNQEHIILSNMPTHCNTVIGKENQMMGSAQSTNCMASHCAL